MPLPGFKLICSFVSSTTFGGGGQSRHVAKVIPYDHFNFGSYPQHHMHQRYGQCSEMKAALISILLSYTLVTCRQDIGCIKSVNAMDALMAEFSSQWIADSLGENGFRVNHYRFDSINRTWLINELSFKGHTEKQILKWLGEPCYSGRHKEDNGLIMTYPVGRGSNDPDIDLIIYFDENDKVNDITKKIGMAK